MKRYYLMTLFVLSLIICLPAQILTEVKDSDHIDKTNIEGTSEIVSSVFKGIENGWLEKISKVQKFLKEASHIVSAIIKNLKMTKELVKVEKDISALYLRSSQQLNEMDDFWGKWKHRWILAQLFYEGSRIFEVFDIATQQNKGIIDDKGRIELIKQVLKKAKAIKRAMKVAMRRTNRHAYQLKRQRQEIETFGKLFGVN